MIVSFETDSIAWILLAARRLYMTYFMEKYLVSYGRIFGQCLIQM